MSKASTPEPWPAFVLIPFTRERPENWYRVFGGLTYWTYMAIVEVALPLEFDCESCSRSLESPCENLSPPRSIDGTTRQSIPRQKCRVQSAPFFHQIGAFTSGRFAMGKRSASATHVAPGGRARVLDERVDIREGLAEVKCNFIEQAQPICSAAVHVPASISKVQIAQRIRMPCGSKHLQIARLSRVALTATGTRPVGGLFPARTT